MKRIFHKNITGKMLALSLGTMFLLSGCGTKQEVISDYGPESTGKSETASDKKTESSDPSGTENTDEGTSAGTICAEAYP